MLLGMTRHVNRRDVLRLGLAGGSLGAAGILSGCAVGGISIGSSPAASAGPPIEPRAGLWKTWVLSRGSQLRPEAPPGGDASQREIDELKSLARRRDATALGRIAYWDAATPAYHWLGVNLDQISQGKGPGKGANASHHIALVNVAMYEAAIATWDAKYAYARPRPSQVDDSLSTAVANPASPSYPSEHAAVGAAAAAVLSYLYPQDAGRFGDLLTESTQSRLLAGVQYRSDITAGLRMGQRVGDLVVARAKADGFVNKWQGTVPSGPGVWVGTNPLYPLAGTWKTWALPSAGQFRPEPPPAYDSAERAAELDEVKGFARTVDSNTTAYVAQSVDGQFGVWYRTASQTMFEQRTSDNLPRAARAYALMSIAHNDAMVAGWEAKYTYWTARPSMLRPDITTLFPNPNHPSYPSAHGFESGAMAAVMSYLFPSQGDALTALAEAYVNSRLWAGIHYRSDLTAGLALGRAVAEVVVDRGKADGSHG